jgi:hypothetical protein
VTHCSQEVACNEQHNGAIITKVPLQQNSWVKFGSGRSPSVWYRAISMVS